MHSATIHRRAGAIVFVVAAVATTVALVVVLRGGGSSAGQPQIVGAGAAPPPASTVAAQHGRIYGSDLSPQQMADAAVGNNGELVPLKPSQFNAPVARYRTYARGRAAALAADVRVLTATLRGNDRAAGRAAWQRADSSMNRIGAAYGALGSLGDEISGDAGALPAIEAGLWGSAAPRSLASDSQRLQRDVARLRPVLAHSPIDPLTYATRAHEILEDVQRDRLTLGSPSDSGVRATADGVAATRVVLATLTPLLNGRGDAQAQSHYWLRRLGSELTAIRHAHGGRYPQTGALTRRERETLDGRLGAALEALGGIPGELETANPPKIPTIP